MKFTPMTVNVLKNLFNTKSTRPYPFVVRDPFPDARGELYNEIEKCIFCGSCSRKCPSQCITVDKEKGLWTCDPFACVYCGTCMDVCPVHCLHHKETWRHVTPEREMIVQQGTPPKPKKKKEDAGEGNDKKAAAKKNDAKK
ncbi:4Fe-4S ferredoxin [Oceanidesulfovibrio indonesiensis]|uniref:4Fe-4S ferredoxin n=1 Tax=Oceanidesulfovibrio indonesiensis TaxID=54767 RepID=A0A7M3MJ37_9BACT|nr:4Fe-4S binding protein [Oceanidesulfovibrio indonesiensis]TVM19823.1 4Fe-4S ferredoxin [Oceanidesulfovibrio indonesiensis]